MQEGSMMDEILRNARIENGSSLEKFDKSQYPDEFKEPKRVVGDYQREASFEILMYNIPDTEKAKIKKQINEKDRDSFVVKVKEIQTQLEYFKWYDTTEKYLSDLQKKKEEEVFTNIGKKIKEYEVMMINMFDSLRTFLNLRNYLAKDLTPEVYKEFILNAINNQKEEYRKQAVEEIVKIKSDITLERVKNAYLFNEYYRIFVIEKPEL